MWLNDDEVDTAISGELEVHFPSLQHLVIENIVMDAPMLAALARKYPNIERSTCQLGENCYQRDISRVVGSILSDVGEENDQHSP